MKLTITAYRAPELTALEGPQSPTWLRQLLSHWLAFYSAEPLIAWQRTCEGEITFTAYDPVDRSTHTFATEDALRVWLDQRYYAR
ncbi:MAG: hypothetical protein HC926_05160 [Synechococcaceae cyanobacterium SM2_3_60]|nr:hypothetical protein [Synechococcaceae cyanobacterium SM2_3_60]